MRRTGKTAVVLALAALLPASAAAATKPAATAKTPPISGPGLETIVQDDGLLLYRPAAEVEAAVQRMKQLGIDRVRITASWSSLTRASESDVKPGGFDGSDPAAYEQARWSGLDAAIRAIRGAGLKALVDIGFWAPHWATSDPPGPRARADIDPQEYAAFAKALVLRYSGAFTPPPVPPEAPPPTPSQDESVIKDLLQPLVPFPLPVLPHEASTSVRAAQNGAAVAPSEPLPKVDRFIIWNEPNHQGLLLPQWKPDKRTPASPVVYRAMLRASYAAIKQARRSASVLIGNTSSTGGTRGTGPVAPLEFLRELACVDAKLKPRTTGDCANFTIVPGDGWAHHPYSQNERPSRVSKPTTERGDLRIADLPQLAATLDQLVRMGRIAPANRSIYLTEFGYETKGIPGRPHVDERQQARWMTWAEYLADRVPTVKSFAQFLLRDQPPAPERVSQSAARPYGEYSTGLLHVDGKDKVIATSFLAGLFAQLQPKGKVLLYGRLRLGAGPRLVVLQRQVKGGRWKQLGRLTVDGRASFQRTFRHASGAQYRMTYPSPAGTRASSLGLKPVPVAG
jgi:hypothetical protein